MKRFLSIAILLPIIAITLYFLMGYYVNKSTDAPVAIDQVVESPTTQCFAYHHDATSDAPYTVDEYIKITVNENDNTVTGSKQGTQSGPDMTNGYEGTLTGIKTDDKIDVVFAYTIEGSSNKEQELYAISDSNLIKQRYPLKEVGDMLVPDTTQEPTEMTYKNIECI